MTSAVGLLNWIEYKASFYFKEYKPTSPNLLSHIFHISIKIYRINMCYVSIQGTFLELIKLAPSLCLNIFYWHLYYMASMCVSSLPSSPCTTGLIRHRCYPSIKSNSDSPRYWITNFFLNNNFCYNTLYWLQLSYSIMITLHSTDLLYN